MSYKYEKTSSGQDLVITFGDGIGADPYSGPNRLNQVDLSTPGEVAVGYPITTSTTSGATLGTPIADSVRFFTYGTPGVPSGSPQSFAILDTNGRVWESSSITGTWTFLAASNSTSGSTLNDGIAYWLGYLWKTRGSALDYWNGSTWATGWAGLSLAVTGGGANYKHFMYVGSDNVLYITNGNYLASVTAPSPTAFVPTDVTTYSASAVKLQLPVTDLAISLAEVGSGNSQNSTLLIGGQQNAVYPWDKTSSSFALPIYVGDSYIKNMVSVNQNAFIFTGNASGRGRIYVTNGSQADLYFKMPDYVFGEQDPYYEFGDAIFHRNNLIWGCFVTKNSGASVILTAEVWALDLDTKQFRSISTIPANATAKANATCLIPTFNLSTPGFGYIVGWDDNGSAPGIGYSGTTAGIGTASIITEEIPVGTFLSRGTPTNVEYKLRSPLQSGENIVITPVVDGIFVSALSFSPTPTTGGISGVANVNWQGAQWLKFHIAATGNNASSGVRLREIRVRT